MEINRDKPSLFVYDIGRKKLQGVIGEDAYNVTANYRFAAASDMEFSINKYYYDENTYSWKENPYYELLSEHKVIATSDTSSRYKIKNYHFNDPSLGSQHDRFDAESGTAMEPLSFSPILNECVLASETLLFDIGTEQGYTWKTFCHIDDSGGLIEDTRHGTMYQHNVVCPDFIPVTVGDIVALACRFKNNPSDGDNDNDNQIKKNGVDIFQYTIHYYTYNDASSHFKKVNCTLFDPVGRVYISEGDFGSVGGVPIKSGYIRIEYESRWVGYVSGGSNEFRWIYPGEDVVHVYSGERRCAYYLNYSDVPLEISERWWVVDNVTEDCECDNAKKTVSLKAYEYSTSRKLFSISEGVCPLYIPDSLVNLVQSSHFIYDYTGSQTYARPQRMKRGIINQVLDYLPGWSIGSISGILACRYRTISSVDNGNIYSFLTNTIQSVYNCYVIFDSENLKIHILRSEDIFSLGSDSILGWSNVIKGITKKTDDSKFVTSLKASLPNSSYSLGAVNPQGNGIVYNFDYVKNDLNIVVDSNHVDGNGNAYTLKNRIEVHKQRIADLLLRNYPEGGFSVGNKAYYYPELSKLFISLTQECTKLELKVQDVLSKYHQLVDQININLGVRGTGAGAGLSDSPLTMSALKTYNTDAKREETFYSVSLYRKIYDAAEVYWGIYNNYNTKNDLKNQAYKQLQWVARRLSISPSVIARAISRGESPVFTVAEAEYLNNYIIEGEWKNENVVFKTQYEANDIIDTLNTAYENLKSDMQLYCKPNYDFELKTVDILSDPELSQAVDDIFLGNYLNIDDHGHWIKPVLLEVRVDYDNKGNGSLSMSTDYKRKPLEIRFGDMFKTIQQTSVTTPAYTFDG